MESTGLITNTLLYRVRTDMNEVDYITLSCLVTNIQPLCIREAELYNIREGVIGIPTEVAASYPRSQVPARVIIRSL